MNSGHTFAIIKLVTTNIATYRSKEEMIVSIMEESHLDVMSLEEMRVEGEREEEIWVEDMRWPICV